ncbi:MAG: hypothetical protein LUQ31_02910 [Methanoregula sp.]|nr:hypothetical protein [Methanoregula sp.]
MRKTSTAISRSPAFLFPHGCKAGYSCPKKTGPGQCRDKQNLVRGSS